VTPSTVPGERPAGRAKSPVRYLRAAWADWPRALREPQTIRKFTWFVLVALVILFGSAAKQTHGAIHLVMALALFGTLLVIGLSIGAVIAEFFVANRPAHKLLKTDEDAESDFVRTMVGTSALVLSVKWMLRFGLFTLPLALEQLAGIPFGQATRMLTGTATGLLGVIGVNVLWLLLAFRAPHRVYVPEKFPRWWFRISMFSGGIIGAAVALDPGALPAVFRRLLEVVLDI
jgi:hypothetical protein